MEKETKKYLWWGGGALLLLIIVATYFFYSGKKTVTIAPLPIDNPDNGQTSGLSNTSDGELSILATNLFTDLDEYDVFASHDPAPYTAALALSDTSFAKMYNFYNTKYQLEDGGKTLTAKISGQYSIPFTSWESLQKSMLTRLGKLNLK